MILCMYSQAFHQQPNGFFQHEGARGSSAKQAFQDTIFYSVVKGNHVYIYISNLAYQLYFFWEGMQIHAIVN